VKDIIWKRKFLRELLSIADGFRSERMLRGAIVLWRTRYFQVFFFVIINFYTISLLERESIIIVDDG
jgi:hypothetical protein